MTLSVKKLARISCYLCGQSIKWIPVVSIFVAAGWSYYVYIIKICIFSMESSAERALCVTVHHLLLLMLLWSYYQTVMAPAARVPERFRLGPEDEERLVRTADRLQHFLTLEEHIAKHRLPVHTHRRVYTRYCRWCRWVQPDRCHHCRACNTCVLKKDHHCPWMNNCIGFTNYKFFLLFLSYTAAHCMFIAQTSFHYFFGLWMVGPEGEGYTNIVALFWVSALLGFGLIPFLGFHCYLLLSNQSTHEFIWPPRFVYGENKRGFSMSHYANFSEVFGDSKLKWFLPIFTSRGDGVTFYVSPLVSQDRGPATRGDGAALPVTPLASRATPVGSPRSLEDGTSSGGPTAQSPLVPSPESRPSSVQEYFSVPSAGPHSELDVRPAGRCWLHGGAGVTAAASEPALHRPVT